VAVVASELVGFAATLEPEVPIDFLLTATVRMAGERLRVTSKLIDARALCHVWVGRFDSALQPFDAQASIAERIVRQVIATLGRDPADELHHAGEDVGGRDRPRRAAPRARSAPAVHAWSPR
jgi:hypothetical protein